MTDISLNKKNIVLDYHHDEHDVFVTFVEFGNLLEQCLAQHRLTLLQSSIKCQDYNKTPGILFNLQHPDTPDKQYSVLMQLIAATDNFPRHAIFYCSTLSAQQHIDVDQIEPVSVLSFSILDDDRYPHIPEFLNSKFVEPMAEWIESFYNATEENRYQIQLPSFFKSLAN